jgi:DNA-cytosine methyltransferase
VRMLDLFTGIGGFSLAASWVWGEELDLAGFCEQDVYCGKVLKKNFPDVPIYPDIKELRGEWFQDIDLITGGFPCQDISVAGKGAGIDGDRSGLWSELCRIISEVRPRYALIENVPMLIHRGLERVLLDLTEIGYDAEWQVIGADDVGARHKRKRIWIVAYPDSTRLEKHGAFNPDLSWRSGKTLSSKEPEEKTMAHTNSDGTKRDQPSNGQRGGIMENGDTSRETMAHTQHAGRPETEIAGQDHGIQPAIASGQELCLDELEGTSGLRSPGDMADTWSARRSSGGLHVGDIIPTLSRGETNPSLAGCERSEDVPDTNTARLQGSEETGNLESQRTQRHQFVTGSCATGDTWTVEPDVGRVANGIPKRVDRLRGLGNAIVPQVAALIMQMIKDDI